MKRIGISKANDKCKLFVSYLKRGIKNVAKPAWEFLNLPISTKYNQHYVKYVRIQVFSDPFFPVPEQNRRFCL